MQVIPVMVRPATHCLLPLMRIAAAADAQSSALVVLAARSYIGRGRAMVPRAVRLRCVATATCSPAAECIGLGRCLVHGYYSRQYTVLTAVNTENSRQYRVLTEYVQTACRHSHGTHGYSGTGRADVRPQCTSARC